MTDRLNRLIPFTGFLFVVLVVVGGPVLEGSTPGRGASAQHVMAFYADHRARERGAAFVLAFAFVAFMLFAAALRDRWRRFEHADGAATLLLVAAGVLAVGQTLSAGVGYALADDPARLTPAAAQTLNLLANDLVLTSGAGFFLFGLCAGAIILRGVAFPKWLGWLALAMGLLFVLPPIEPLGFVLLLVWCVAVSVGMLRQGRRPQPALA
ncbi:MAG TPA: hypothetical protein VL988_08055 [Solirubrobacteraceae bacterium]|nr:hypothetical protein [Solirubrobacteraceae bacterium]